MNDNNISMILEKLYQAAKRDNASEDVVNIIHELICEVDTALFDVKKLKTVLDHLGDNMCLFNTELSDSDLQSIKASYSDSKMLFHVLIDYICSLEKSLSDANADT